MKVLVPTLLVFVSLSTVHGQQPLRSEIRYMKGLIKKIDTICDGETPIQCNCDTSGVDPIKPPFKSGLLGFSKVLVCRPNYCLCPDGSEKDSRPREMRELLKTCPRDEMESCVCKSDEKRVDFPFDLQTIFFDCRPYKCRCKGEDEDRPVTAFGCKNGGSAWCKSKTDFVCSDGTVVTRGMAITSKLDQKCVCEDNKLPKCQSTNAQPLCPGGESIDLEVGNPGVIYTACDTE